MMNTIHTLVHVSEFKISDVCNVLVSTISSPQGCMLCLLRGKGTNVFSPL